MPRFSINDVRKKNYAMHEVTCVNIVTFGK
jgi:hypothetical protein